MLILTRKIGETIIIGDHVEVKVVDVRGNRVRLGISAPKDVPVHRSEVLETIERMQKRFTDNIPSVHFNGNEVITY